MVCYELSHSVRQRTFTVVSELSYHTHRQRSFSMSVDIEPGILDLDAPMAVKCYVCSVTTEIDQLLKLGEQMSALPVSEDEKQYTWEPAPEGWFCPSCYQILSTSPSSLEKETDSTSQEYDSRVFCQDCGSKIETPEENAQYCAACRPEHDSDPDSGPASDEQIENRSGETLLSILHQLNLSKKNSSLPSDVPVMSTLGGGTAEKNDCFTLQLHSEAILLNTNRGTVITFDASFIDATFAAIDRDGNRITSGDRIRFQSKSVRLLSEFMEFNELAGKTVVISIDGTGLNASYSVTTLND